MRPRIALNALLVAVLVLSGVALRPAGAAQGASVIPPFAWTHPIGGEARAGKVQDLGYFMFDDGPVQGAPLGGIGAGTIGRTYNGDFRRWHTNVGKHLYASVPADMFSVYTNVGGKSSAQALYAGTPADQSLSKWTWNYPTGKGMYWALYPRSGYVYDGLPIPLSVEQFSPVIPNDYRASSYPLAIFTYTASNPGKEPVTVGLMFTWQNMLARTFRASQAGGLMNTRRQEGDLTGIVYTRKESFSGAEWDGSLAIAVQRLPGVEVNTGTQVGFKANGDGTDIWNDFAADGALNDSRQNAESKSGDSIGAGISATVTLQPGQSVQVPFYLAWDQPVMTFGENDDGVSWYKRYTAFFGRDGRQAWNIISEAAKQREAWHKAILDWQNPILADKDRPDWYKTALFNELYYVADGGSAWENGKVGEPEPPKDYIGRYSILECFDYLFYATFDVDFYASFALVQLWPELEKRVMHDFALTIPLADPTPHLIQSTRKPAARKLAGAVPHDLGSPNDSPWLLVNSFVWRDVSNWKDLAPKFVLRLHRDAVLLKDPELVKSNWAAVKQAMAYLAAMDRDGDGIPENEGIPDQTYDNWSASGVSAYSGGLWLAALKAGAEMAKLAGDSATQADYEARLMKAQAVYEQKLWNGTYYRYDSSGGPHSDSIMADMLAGQWYLDFVKLEVLPADNVQKSLKTIYAQNVQAFAGGKMGAVNGMLPDGKIDTSSDQSQEVWVGTTYALASTMLNRGLRTEAWETAHGVYLVNYETHGYWFRTPEAYVRSGEYRASMYMRPLAIWAIDLAYKTAR